MCVYVCVCLFIFLMKENIEGSTKFSSVNKLYGSVTINKKWHLDLDAERLEYIYDY